MPFARWSEAKPNFRETFGTCSRRFPEGKAGEFDDKLMRMKKIDKNILHLEKNSYFCSPKFGSNIVKDRRK